MDVLCADIRELNKTVVENDEWVLAFVGENLVLSTVPRGVCPEWRRPRREENMIDAGGGNGSSADDSAVLCCKQSCVYEESLHFENDARWRFVTGGSNMASVAYMEG